MSEDEIVSKLVAAWNTTSAEDREAGEDWYRSARAVVGHMAARHGVSRSTAAGVVAALSPRIHWARNLDVADVVLSGGIPSGVFKASLAKALAIRSGRRANDVLKGPKVRAFYRALMGDRDAAVVDTWMVKVIGWTGNVKSKAYGRIATAMQSAAKRVGVAVTTLQAATWVAIRNRAY